VYSFCCAPNFDWSDWINQNLDRSDRMYCSYILQLPMQSVPITTNVVKNVNLNPARCTGYNIMW
jgi:hypothetical protein